MALLQIAEPGESAAPHQHKLAVGIDLGTTNSLVATVRSGLAVVLSDELGRPLLPSVVRYAADGSSEVGYEAQDQQALDPCNTIVSVKRLMGRGLSDIAHSQSMPYTFENAENGSGMMRLRTAAGVKSPVDGAQTAEGGHGERHSEGPVAGFKLAESRPRQGVVEPRAAAKAGGQDIQGGPAGGQADFSYVVHGARRAPICPPTQAL